MFCFLLQAKDKALKAVEKAVKDLKDDAKKNGELYVKAIKKALDKVGQAQLGLVFVAWQCCQCLYSQCRCHVVVLIAILVLRQLHAIRAHCAEGGTLLGFWRTPCICTVPHLWAPICTVLRL